MYVGGIPGNGGVKLLLLAGVLQCVQLLLPAVKLVEAGGEIPPEFVLEMDVAFEFSLLYIVLIHFISLFLY